MAQSERTAAPMLLDAAQRLIDATDQEYEVGDDGWHELVAVRAPVEAWLCFMEVVLAEGQPGVETRGRRGVTRDAIRKVALDHFGSVEKVNAARSKAAK